MKAAVVPDVHGKWQLKGVPIPKPRTDQVLNKVHTSGICICY
jgi:D-arabinose 1-dehydrogenase-like Zn-dependent alcohol dehydrogenase